MPPLRALVIYLLLVAMELLAGFAVLLGSGLVDAVHAGDAVLWMLLLAGLGGLVTGLGIALVGPAEPWNRISLLAGAVPWAALPAFLTARDPADGALVFVVLIVGYWRGLRISLEPADSDAVKREFGLGFGLVFLGFLWGITRDVNHTRPFWTVLGLIGVAYTATAMVALGVARLERQREPGSGFAVLIAVGIQLGILLLLALGAIALFGHDLAGAVGNATRPFFDALGTTLYRAVAIFAVPLQWLFDWIRSHERNVTPPTPTRPPLPGHLYGKRPHAGHAAQTVASILGALVLAVVIGIVLYVVWRFLPRIRRYRPPKGYREERTTLLTPAEMLRAVVTWLLSLFRKGGERVVQMVERTRRRIWGKYPEDPVRRVYVQLLRRSAAAGVTRPPNATPDEFGGRMAGHWPDVAFDLGAITEAYVQRRYGEVQPELEALGRLGRHWQNVRTAIRVPRTVPGRQRPTDPQSGDGV